MSRHRTSVNFDNQTDENLSILRFRAKKIKSLRKEPSDSLLLSSIINFLVERSDLENVMFDKLDELMAQDGRGKHSRKKPITYLIHDKQNNLHKIGKSIIPMERLNTLRQVYNDSLEIVGVSSKISEKDLSRKYQEFSCPQTSDKEGYSEWFHFDKETLGNVIKDLYE